MEETREIIERLISNLFRSPGRVSRLDVIVLAGAMDLPDIALEVIECVPPGSYDRQRLCDQLNSAITAHGWSRTLGTFE